MTACNGSQKLKENICDYTVGTNSHEDEKLFCRDLHADQH